jgi:hypothetical protein
VTSFRLFAATDGPPAVNRYSGDFLAGLAFHVTAWNTWLEGFWWWVPADGDTGPQPFALWQLFNTATSETTAGLVAAATVRSGPLKAGQWNYITLGSPVALSAGVPYVAATGWVAAAGFPATNGQFGPGQAFANGIASGPLAAYSDTGAGSPTPNLWAAQGLFSNLSGSDPTAAMPGDGFESANFWLDVQVTDVPPAGATSRLWPSLPVPPNTRADSALPYTLATAITLSEPCAVQRVWFCSLAGSTLLPAEIGIFSEATQQLVPGTHITGPAWSDGPGRGWVSHGYQDLTLPAGSYRVAVCSGEASQPWNYATIGYFTTGAGGAGITVGALTAPGEAAMPGGSGQASYNQGSTLAWPGSYFSGESGGPCYWVDIEVAAAGSRTGLMAAFFP